MRIKQKRLYLSGLSQQFMYSMNLIQQLISFHLCSMNSPNFFFLLAASPLLLIFNLIVMSITVSYVSYVPAGLSLHYPEQHGCLQMKSGTKIMGTPHKKTILNYSFKYNCFIYLYRCTFWFALSCDDCVDSVNDIATSSSK